MNCPFGFKIVDQTRALKCCSRAVTCVFEALARTSPQSRSRSQWLRLPRKSSAHRHQARSSLLAGQLVGMSRYPMKSHSNQAGEPHSIIGPRLSVVGTSHCPCLKWQPLPRLTQTVPAQMNQNPLAADLPSIQAKPQPNAMLRLELCLRLWFAAISRNPRAGSKPLWVLSIEIGSGDATWRLQ